MLICLRDKKNKLKVVDILDIDFNMSVDGKEDTYYINVNSKYRLDEEFVCEEAAEEKMIEIAGLRNHLELELRDC